MDPTPAPKPSKGRRRIALVLATVVALVIGVVYVALIWDGVFGNGGKPLTTLSPHGVQSQYIQNLITPVFAIGRRGDGRGVRRRLLHRLALPGHG